MFVGVAAPKPAHGAPAATAKCTISDVEVRGIDWRLSGSGEALITVGDLVNNCAGPANVGLKATARDSQGLVVDTQTIGYETRHVPPNQPYAFKIYMGGGASHISNATSVTVDVDRVRPADTD